MHQLRERGRSLARLSAILLVAAAPVGWAAPGSGGAVESQALELSRAFNELAIQIPPQDLVDQIVMRRDGPEVVPIMECFRRHGVVPELTLLSEEELKAATQPMLIRTIDGNWHAFRSSEEDHLRPAWPPEAGNARFAWDEFMQIWNWADFVITLKPLLPGNAMPEPAQMRLESWEKYFGEAGRGSNVEATFPFKNVGGMPLRFRNASPEKKAIQLRAVPDQTEYAPGESGELRVIYDTSYGQGPVSVAADLMTNDPRRMHVTLELKGKVVDPVFTVPESIEFGSIVRGATASKEIHLVSIDGTAFGVAELSSSSPSARFSVSEPKGAGLLPSVVPIRIVVDSSEMAEGEFEVTCKVELTPEPLGSITFPVSGTVVASDSVR